MRKSILFASGGFFKLKYIKVLLLTVFILTFNNFKSLGQCTVTGVSGSGFNYADFCAPGYNALYYDFIFGTTAPPEPSYRVLFMWGDGTSTNKYPTVQSKMVGATTVYYLRAEADHIFPAEGNCEYTVNIVLVDNGFQCNDSRQVQIISNWHQDDIATAMGSIRMDPLQHDVCEGDALIDHQFTDISNFACNLRDFPSAQKPNHTARHEQFVYGTHPLAGKGIPNLYIKVGTAQTVVYLTDASGNPVPNSWTVDPVTGATVSAYSTVSGYFEGPVVKIDVDAVTGNYSLNDTYPISFDGVGTVANDQFEVTVRNWNICNPWNGSQTNPNSAQANTGTSIILIVDAPPAPTVPNRTVCSGQNQTLTVSSTPVGTLNWYADAALTTFLGSGSTYTPSPSKPVGNHDFWVVDRSNAGLLCQSPATKVTLTVREPLNLSDAITGISAVCLGATGLTFSLPNNPATQPVGGATEYNWTAPGGWTNLAGDGTKQITVDATGTTGVKTITVEWRYITSPECPSSPVTFPVTVYAQPTGPTLNSKTPNLTTVCAGQSVRATFIAGTGGVGCSDQFQYRFDGGGWASYTLGNNLNTTGHTSVEIQGRRAGCTAGTGCNGTSWITLASWNVNPQPVGPTLNTKTPNLTTVCSGTLVSATFNAGSGGVGCSDNFQYRFDGGTWHSYTAGTNLNTTGHTSVEIQGRRANCTANSGCTGTSYVILASWNVNPQPVGPTLNTKTPNLATVCSGQLVRATFNAGTGGVGCSDNFQYRFDGAGGWLNYTPGVNLNTTGHTLVQIQGRRANCTAGAGCSGTSYVILVTWNVNPQPIGPTLDTKTPNTAAVCAGTDVSATFNAGSGGVGCTDDFQYRFDGGTWATYTAGTNLNTTGHISVEIQGRRANCTAGAGCSGTPYVLLASWSVNPSPAPSISGPNDVCAGETGVIYSTADNAGNTYSWIVSGGTITAGAGSHSITVTWGAAGSGYVRVTETNGVPCSTTTPDYSVTINPEAPNTAPTIVNAQTNVCRNGTLLIDVTDVANANQYVWDYSWLGGAGNEDVSTGVSQITIDLTGMAPGVYTVTVAGKNGCGRGPWMVPAHTFTINDLPDLSPLSATVCSDVTNGTALSITNSGAYCSGITYNITNIAKGSLNYSAGNPVTGTGFPANEISDDAWTNKTAASASVIYTIVPVSSQNCSGAPEDVIITINPEPDLSNLNKTVCSDAATGITLSDEHGLANMFEIVSITSQAGLNPAAGNSTSGAGKLANAIANDKFTNKTAAALTVTYAIIPRIDGGCIGDQENVVVTINPEPDLKDLDKPVCSDAASGITLSDEHGIANMFDIVSITPQAGLTPAAGNATTGTGKPANALVNDKWTNKTAGSLTVTYAIIPRIDGGCIGDQENVVVTINPEPDLSSLNKSVCSDEATGITLSDVHGLADRFEIVLITPQAGLSPAAGNATTGTGKLANAIANDKWTNKTAGSLTVTYSIIPRIDGGCIGDQENVVVTINPEPDLSSLNKSVCSDEATGITLSDVHGLADRFEIVSITPQTGLNPAAGNATTGTGKLANAIVNDKWTNKTAGSLTVTYAIIPRIDGGCIGDQENVVVTINPEPDLKDLDKTVCSTVPIGITLSDVHNLADRFEIVSITPDAGLTGDPGNAAIGPLQAADAIADDKWTNLTANPLQVIYAVIPRINGGCIGDQENIEVTISPEPDLSDLNTTVCSGVNIGVTLSDVNGLADQFDIVTITAEAGLTPGGSNAVVGTLKPADYISSDIWINTTSADLKVTYGVIPSIGGTCYGQPEDVIITVRPPVIPGSITGSTAICYGEDAPVIANQILASGGDGNISYSWYYTENLAAVPGSADWNLIGSATGSSYDPGILTNPTKFVRKAQDGSCPDEVYSEMITININPLPVTSAITGSSVLCEDATNKVYQVVNTPGSTYAWTVPPSLTITSPPGLYFIIVDAVPGMATPGDKITVTETVIATGCVGTPVELPVTVVPIQPGVVVNGPASICLGDTATYSVPDNSGSTYSWSVPAGAYIISDPNLHSVEVTFKMAVTGDVSVVENSNGVCNTIHTPVTVTVNPLPAIFNLTAPLAYCVSESGVTITLSGSQVGVNYQLYNSVGPVDAPIPGTGSALTWLNKENETYYVIATNATTGCKQLMNGTVVPVINVVDGGEIGSDQAVCENSTPAAFTSTVAGTAGGVLTYQWQSSPDNSTWTDIPGATSAVYASGPLSSNTYFRRVAISTMGSSVCKDYSASVLVTVIIFNPGSIGSDILICEGTAPASAFTSVTPSGIGTFTYRWMSSTDGVNYTFTGGTSETYTAGVLTEDTWFKREVTATYMTRACIEETNAVKVTVINFSPGSIGSDQTICEGTAPATFTSVAASGDGTKTYQWQFSTDSINYENVLSGGLNATYTSDALSQKTWFRRISYATIDTKTCAGITDTIRVKVISFDPGTIGTNQNICEGEIPDPIAETASPSGNGTFTYLWQSSLDDSNWNNITGSTNPDYAPGPLTQDTYFRRQVSSELDGRTCTEWTSSVIVRVNNLTPGSISGTQTICEGDIPAQLTETSAGTSDFGHTYQWQESTDEGLNWANVSSGGTDANYTPPALIADTWFKRLVISTVGLKTCTEESNVVRVTVNNFNPGNIEEDQTICENTPAALLTSITPTGDGTFSYRWFSSPDGNAFTQIGGALSETYNPGILTQDTWYYREVKSTLNGKECIENTDTIKITVNNLTPGSISDDQFICEGGDPDPFTSGGTLTYDGTVSYMWQSSTDGINFTDIGVTGETYDAPALTEDTWYRRGVTSTIGLNECTDYTNSVKVTVINFTPGSIGSSQTICEGATPAPFTSVAASGDGTKSYQWQFSTDSINYSNVLTGGLNASYSSGPLTQDTWFRRLSTATEGSVACMEITDTIKVTVINFDPGSISGPQTICENGTPAAFTSTDASGDGVITYQWQASLDGTNYTNITGATENVYAHGSMTTDTWFRRQATATLNGAQCIDHTTPVLITVNNMTPGSISGIQTICEGATPSAFTSVPATGDGIITYNWMQSSDNGANWGSVPSGGDAEIYVAPDLDADMWYKRVATSTSGGIPCTEESNVIMVTVNNFNPGNIAAEQTICENTAPAPFTSTTPTGDGVFTYRWFNSTDGLSYDPIPTAISETYSPGILAQDTWYFREVTSTVGTNKCIARTDTIKVTVNNFDPGDIAGTQTICEDTAPSAFTESAPAVSYDGADISYQWQDSPDGIFFTDIPSANGITYTAPALPADTWYRRAVKSTLGANECTEYSSIIKVTVINFAPGSIGSDQTICEGTAPASFTSVAASGDGTKSYQWQLSTDSINYSNVPSGGLNATYSAGTLTQDTWFRRLSTATVGSDKCTEITDTIKITVINFDPGTISVDQTICEGETPAEVTSPAATGDGIFAYQWQSSTDGSSFSSINGATTQNYAPGALTVDTWFKRQVNATVNGMSCIKFTPAVMITVNNLQPGSIGGAQTICVNGTPSVLTSVTAASGDGTITYQWQESADNGNTWENVPSDGNGPTYAPPALSADMLYKRIAFSDAGGKICPAESNTVKITVVNFDPGSIGDAQTICEGTAPNALTSVSPSGDGSFTYKWFKSTDDSTYEPVPGAESETYSPGILAQDTWYYREVTASIGVTTCSANTNKVLITVNNFVPGSLDADQTICEGDDPAIISGIAPSGDGMSYTYQWYESIDGIVFTEINLATSETYDPPALLVDTWYKRAATSHLNGNACTEETAPVRIWVINFNPGTIGENQTICENTAPAPFTGTAPSGDGSFTYSWEYSTDSLVWDPVAGISTATYSAPALTEDTWYRRIVTSEVNGFTCSEMTPPVKVTVNNFDPGTITADQWICEGETPAPFGSGSPSGDGAFTYQWQSSLNGSTFSNITGATEETYSAGPLVADTWYKRLVTSTLNGNNCTESTPEIIVTVNNVTAGTIGSDQIICEGSDPDPLTSVTPVFDGIVSYEWQSSINGTDFNPVSGANDETYDPPALNADTWYKRIVTSTLHGVPCSEESNVVKITVNNFDPGSISDNQTICEGSAPAPILSVTPTGDGIFSYKWFRSIDGTNFTEILGALSETYNPGNLIADTWFKREVTSTLGTNTCTEINDPVKITVNNLDPGIVTGEEVICEGVVPSPITGTVATGDGTITYQWRFSNDGVNYTDITTDGQDQNYVPGALTQDTWYLRTVTSDIGGQKCTEISGSFKVRVNNVNAGTIISDQTICNGSDPVAFISVVHGTGDGTVTYEWQSSTDSINFNPIASTNAPNYDSPALTEDTWFRRITRSDITGDICEKISNVVKVTVNEVHGGEIASDQSICFGKTPVPFTSGDDGSGTGTVTYQWQRSGDGVIWNTISGEADKTYAPGVLYSDTWYKRVLISIQNGVLCQAESNPVKITVNSLPVAYLTGGATICPGEPATLTVTITDGQAPYQVNIENHGVETINGPGGDIIVSPADTTVYKILSVTDANGCEAVNMTGTATVNVRDLPAIVTEPADKVICEYGVVNFNVVATGSDLVYQWYVDRKDGNGFVTVTDAGIYYGSQTPTLNLFGVTRDMDGFEFHVTVTTCATTEQSVDVLLTVNTVPEIQEQPKDTIICSGDDAAFAILATGTNLTYKWQYNTGSGGFTDVIDDAVNFSGAADSILYLTDVPLSFNNYIFRVIVEGTCGSPLYSNFVALRVNGPPIPVLHPQDKAVCDGSGPVFFVGNGAGIIDSIRWQVSTNGGTDWSDIHDDAIYSGTTSQQLSLINVPLAYHNNQYRLALKAFCATAYTDAAILTVNPLPVVTFTEDPIPACGDVPIVITPVITGGSGTWVSHNWTGDIGPLNNYFSATPTFKTLIADTYTLNYRVVDDNMCAGEGTVQVVVDAPDATFTQDISMECTPATVKFSKEMTGMKSWEWDFGDGTPVNTTDATVEHVFTNTTSTAIVYRTIQLTVESMTGCTDTKTSMMTIYPAINANLTASDDSVCHGSELIFTADPGANIYKWDYGDLTPVVQGLNTSTHMFLNPTGVPVTRTVEVVTTSLYGCKDSTTIDIVVMPMPLAQFSATPNNQTFDEAGNNVSFTDETTPVSNWTYNWDFDDGITSSDQNPQHTFTGTGTYNVILSVTNGKCSSQISHQVNILPVPPVADFDSIPSGCTPWSITTKNTSLNTEAPGTTYRWDFGDGNYSTEREPAYTYFTPGEYRVELTVTGPGGVSMKPQVVRAYPSPKAYFEVSPTLVFANDERVRCFNLTEGGDYFVWTFGDGDTSRLRDPYHKYMEEGVYDITLWAYSNYGCSDMFILAPGVTVQPAGDVRFSTVFTPNKTGPIERSDLPTSGQEMDQFFFPPIRDKVIRYKLQIFNRWGVLIFESHDINIPWNGYYKGQLCPQGVYVWYVEGKYANGKPFKKVGDITLLH